MSLHRIPLELELHRFPDLEGDVAAILKYVLSYLASPGKVCLRCCF